MVHVQNALMDVQNVMKLHVFNATMDILVLQIKQILAKSNISVLNVQLTMETKQYVQMEHTMIVTTRYVKFVD